MDSVSCSCPICYDIYSNTDLTPLVIECGHTICKQCLINIFKSRKRSCPLCKTNLLKRNANDYPKNFQLLDNLDTFQNMKIVDEKCNCGKENSIYCQNCRLYICQNCIKKHTGHNLIAVDSNSGKVKQDFVAVAQAFKSQSLECEKKLEELEKASSDLLKVANGEQQRIKGYFGKIRSWVTDYEVLALEENSDLVSKTMDQIDKIREYFVRINQELKEFLDKVETSYHPLTDPKLILDLGQLDYLKKLQGHGITELQKIQGSVQVMSYEIPKWKLEKLDVTSNILFKTIRDSYSWESQSKRIAFQNPKVKGPQGDSISLEDLLKKLQV